MLVRWLSEGRGWRPVSIALALVMLCMAWGSPVAWAAVHTGPGGNQPVLTISAPNPASGPEGTHVIVTGDHWTPQTDLSFTLSSPSGTCVAGSTPLPTPTATVKNDGTFTLMFVWPAVPAGTYAICAFGTGAPANGLASTNTFVKLGAGTPRLILPTSAAAGTVVTIMGANWFPTTSQIELLYGDPGSNGCTTHLTTLPAGSIDAGGGLSGTFIAPGATGPITVTAISPPGSCATGPTLSTTATLTITPAPTATPTIPATPTAGSGTPGPGTPTTGTGTPTSGTPGAGTPLPGNGTPTMAKTPTATACPSGTSACRATGRLGSFPLPLCLALLALFALLLVLFVLLLRRRNEEVVITEEDITPQIDPNTILALGNMRFVRIVRITTQVIDRRTGAVRRTQNRDYDEFVDAGGKIVRRPRP